MRLTVADRALHSEPVFRAEPWTEPDEHCEVD